MKNIQNFNEYLNESTGGSFREKAKELYSKLKSLFKEIEPKFTEEQQEKLLKVNSVNSLNKLNFGGSILKKINAIAQENEKKVRNAYEEVFGTNEEVCALTLISFLLMAGMFYFSYDSWKKSRSGGSCCGNDEGEGWKKSLKEPSMMDKIKDRFKKPAPKAPAPKKKPTIDEILDKMGKKGNMNRLTDEEKEILRRAGRK